MPKQSKKKTPNPGSDEAIVLGCNCPVIDNCHGKGGDPFGNFWINQTCPIHGQKSAGPTPRSGLMPAHEPLPTEGAAVAPGELVYSVAPWKIFRQDAGMGEHDYAVFINDVFFCRTEHRQHADEIIRAIRFTANWRNGIAHDNKVKNIVTDEIIKWLNDPEGGDIAFLPGGQWTAPEPFNVKGLLEKIKELREQSRPLGMVGAPDAPAGASVGAVSEDCNIDKIQAECNAIIKETLSDLNHPERMGRTKAAFRIRDFCETLRNKKE